MARGFDPVPEVSVSSLRNASSKMVVFPEDVGAGRNQR